MPEQTPNKTRLENLVPFRRGLLSYIGRYAPSIAVAVLTSLLAAALEAAFPRLLGWLVDLLGGNSPAILGFLASRGVEDPASTALWLLPTLMAGAMLVAALCTYFSLYSTARVGQDLAARLRRAGFKRLLDVPFADFLRAKSGEIISRLDEGPRNIAEGALTLRDLIKAALTTALVTTLIIINHWRMAIFIFALFILLGVAVHFFNRHARRYSRHHTRATADILGHAGERLGAIELVSVFGAARREYEAFRAPATTYYRYRLKGQALTTAYRGLVQVLVGAGLAGILIYGGSLVSRGLLTTGSLFELIGLLAIAFEPVKVLTRSRLRLAPVGVELARFNSVLAWPPGTTPEALRLEESRRRYLPDPGLLWEEDAGAEDSSAKPPTVAGSLEFENVVFEFEGQRILDGISFHVPAGGTTALVGPSGSGKSTVLNLALGLLEPTRGRVLLDGLPLDEYDPLTLRRVQALVPQEIVLGSGTVADNLRLANEEAGDDDLWRALEAARVDDVVRRLADGLETDIGERGRRLSGGEGQRLAIARAILRAPSLLYLDEPTANLDAESEYALQNALAPLFANRTVLIVAHRLSTVRDAGQILFLEGGRIVERGTHTELTARDGRYAELVRLQSADPAGPAH